MPAAIIPTEWRRLHAYRAYLASRGYARVYVEQRTAIARRACEAAGGEVQLLALTDDQIPMMPGTTRYKGVQRRGILAFREWVQANEVPAVVPSIEQIAEHERVGASQAAAIRRFMIIALSACGDEAYRLTPDQIAEKMVPYGSVNCRSANARRSRIRRAVRLLQADYLESPKSCEVPA